MNRACYREDAGTMNNPHLIDSAVFATTYADATPGEQQRAQVESFIRNDLMQVVDEVFELVDGRLPGAAAVMRLQHLEVDLGEIDFSDYRRQLPARLRARLLQALDDLQHAPAEAAASVDLTDEADAQRAQLLLFLSNGYLPWYARAAAPAGLDTLLIESLDRDPEILLGFLRANADRAQVLERLIKQFSPRSLRRVMRQLAATQDAAARQTLARLRGMLRDGEDDGDSGREESFGQMPAAADPAGPTSREGSSAEGREIDRLQRRLVSALLSERTAAIESEWQILYRGHRRLLRQTLRYYGQRASVRQRIAAGFSDAMRGELLELLDASQQPVLTALVSHAEIFATGSRESGTARAPLANQIWAFSLGYLLLERGARFDARAYLLSILRQMAAATGDTPARLLARLRRNLGALGEANKAAAWSRPLAETIDAVEKADSGDPIAQSEPSSAYLRLRRLKLALNPASAERHEPESKLVMDIRALGRETPWLLRRLQRELQADGDGWRRASAGLPAAVLAELCYALLAQNDRADAARPYGTATELVMAIRQKAASAADRKTLFAYLLERLIAEDLIDLEAAEAQSPAPTKSGEDADGKEQSGAGMAEAVEHSDAALRALTAMGPQPRSRLLRCSELLTTAVHATGAAPSAERLERIKWDFIRDYVRETGYLFNQRFFARRYVEHLIRQLRPGDGARFRVLLIQGLRHDSLPATRELARQLVDIIGDDADDTPRYVEAAAAPPVATDDAALPLENIYIDNAGLVLLAPYLPTLFERLGLVEAGEFVDRDAAERGVHCLQYLVNAQLESPEYQLVLNKLLCGVRPGLPICRGIEIDAATRAQLDGLLLAVTRNWTPLQNTSVDGLRESFLQRGGRLQLHADAWRLAVEARPFDMLLDQLPWSFGTIKFAWMERVIYVEWR